MSTFDIKMPKLGESITEGTIVSWSVKVGDTIKEDDILFEVTTAKVNAEIPSPVSGKIVSLLFKEGDTIPVGTTVAVVELEGEGATESAAHPKQEKEPEAKPEPTNAFKEGDTSPVGTTAAGFQREGEGTAEPAASPNQGKEPETKPQPMNAKTSAPVKVAEPVEAKASGKEEKFYSPVVLQLAGESQVSQEELAQIKGTGYLGRVSKKDIQSYVELKKSGKASSPAVGEAGKSTEVSKKPDEATSAKAAQAPPAEGHEGDRIVEMDPVRRIIADHMVMSKKTSAHVTSVIEADVTKLVSWRKRNKDEFFKREGINLTYMPAIVEAVAKALIEFPQVNASVDGHKMIFKKRINVGVAVALDNGNLIVPVVHDADRMSINGLAHTIDLLAKNARAKKVSVADIEGGTFTITNYGSFRNIIATPIINQPQVAILGVGYIEKKPAVVETPEGDVIAIRHKMYLSLSYDHRIVDGALGGNFLLRIAEYLERWDR